VTQIAFHFGAPDRLQYICRLLRKVVGSGMQAVVWCEDELLAELDRGLWSVSPTDFVAHAIDGAAASVVSRSPVFMTTAMPSQDYGGKVLVNLHPMLPVGFEHFSRVIEVVSAEGADRDSARNKWKQYTAAGHTIQRHDLKRKEATA
jgi:DNA polymerase-3 subunit chi